MVHSCHASERPTMQGSYRTTVEVRISMSASYVMKVSSNGQVSIPAEARARWKADQVIVVDLGDRVVMRPQPADPVAELRGKYQRGPSTDRARALTRSDESAHERRRRA